MLIHLRDHGTVCPSLSLSFTSLISLLSPGVPLLPCCLAYYWPLLKSTHNLQRCWQLRLSLPRRNSNATDPVKESPVLIVLHYTAEFIGLGLDQIFSPFTDRV